MHRSRTVTLSIIVLSLWILGSIIGVIPSETNQNSGVWWYLSFLIFAALIRLTVLYWQTLIHAIKEAPLDNRVGWVVGHFLLGPIVSVPYYYLHRIERISPCIKVTKADKTTGKPNKSEQTDRLPRLSQE